MRDRIVRLTVTFGFIISSVTPRPAPASARSTGLAANGATSPAVILPLKRLHTTVQASTGDVLHIPLPVWNVADKRDHSERLAAPPMRQLETPPITEIRICNVDSGCTGVTTDTLTTDSPLALYAAAYGSEPDPFEGNQPVTWTVSSGAAVAPGAGVSTTLDGNTPGTIAVTATLITTPSLQSSATFTVNVGALHSLTIRDAANGGGSAVGTATRDSGSGWPLYAAGFDVDDNFIADQVVTWTVQGGIGSMAPSVGTSSTFSAGLVGTGVIDVTLQSNPGITDATGIITVVHGLLDHFRVDLASGGTAGQGFTATITAEDKATNTVTSFASGVDLSTSNGGIITPPAVTPTAGVWTGVMTLTTAGTGRQVKAQVGAITGTDTIDVAPGPPASLTVLPDHSSVTAGSSIGYTAIATDTFGNGIGDVTGSTAFALQPGAGGSFTGNTVQPTIRGTWTVTGTNGGASDTTTLTVNPGLPVTLTLQAAPPSLQVANSSTLTATVTDLYGNLVTNGTTVVFSSTIGSIQSPKTTTSGVATSTLNSTVAGTALITATSGAAQKTATVAFTPGPLTYIVVESAPDGTGSPITNVTMSLYSTLTVYAVGYDAYNNVIGPQTAAWTASGLANGRIAPTSGISTTFTPAPILSGTASITATVSPFSAATGVITVQAPVLLISKTSSPDPIVPGQVLQYTIVYTNAGNTTAQNVVVTETYPLSTTYLIAIPSPDIGSGNRAWTIGSLAPGASGTIDVYVQLASQTPVSAALTNTVQFSGAKVATAVYTQTTQVDAAPDVQITKSDNLDPVRVGELLVYTIQYVNTGTGLVSGVRITETYPSQVSFVSASPPALSGTNNVWVTATLGATPKIINVTVRVDTPLPDLTVLDNTVTIDTNETDPFSDQEVTLVRAPTISLTKFAATSTPLANSVLTYTLHYTNSGSTFASTVVVTDAVPLNTTYLSCAPSGCSQAGGTLTWNLGQVPTQTSGLLTMTVRVNNNLDAGTILTNTARISTNVELVSAFTALTSTVVSTPVLTIGKSDGVASAAAGQLLTYTLSYTNSGNAPAKGVVITDRIPSNVTFQSCTNSCVSMGGGVYSFTLNTINAATSGSVRLTVKVDPTLPAGLRAITNTAGIVTTSPDDDPADNFARDADAISTIPSLAMGVSFDSATPYPTKQITYTIRYTNTSAMDTTGVVITATKSPYVTYAGSGWTFVGGYDYTRAVGNLAAGASGSVSYVLNLPYPFTETMDGFINVFAISDNGPGGLPVATASQTTTLGVPDVVVESARLVPRTIAAGVPFTAYVTIRNEGLGRACNPKNNCGWLSVDVFLDPDIAPVSFPYDDGWDAYTLVSPIEPGQAITVAIPNLQFGPTQDFTIYFKVDNWDCTVGTPCIPTYAFHGLVPESDEYNNVLGPIDLTTYLLYVPIVRKN